MIVVISITLFFLVLRFTVTLFNFISNPKLTRVNRHYDDLVSILIPARNEEENILTMLESIKRQEYKHYEVIVYDDESTDNTYRICSSFSKLDDRFKVIKGGPQPAGWLGKTYACATVAKRAKGSYFLFLDADDRLSAGLINSAVHRMKQYQLGLLSIFPNQDMETVGEKITVPLLHYTLLNLLPLRLVFLVKNPSVATACGQFMLFDADAYRENGWHNQVKNAIGEDVEIMRRVKSAGYNGEILLANSMIHCRMYYGYGPALNGFSKNALAVFSDSIAGLLVYILLIIGGPMIVLMTLNLNLIFLMCGLILLTRIMTSLSSAQNAWLNILLHPLQMFNLAVISFLSIQRNLIGIRE